MGENNFLFLYQKTFFFLRTYGLFSSVKNEQQVQQLSAVMCWHSGKISLYLSTSEICRESWNHIQRKIKICKNELTWGEILLLHTEKNGQEAVKKIQQIPLFFFNTNSVKTYQGKSSSKQDCTNIAFWHKYKVATSVRFHQTTGFIFAKETPRD